MKLDYYAWCCNLESDSGEGILAEKYLKNLSLARKLNIKAFSPEINIHYKSGKKIFTLTRTNTVVDKSKIEYLVQYLIRQ